METNPFAAIATTSYADVSSRDRVMDYAIRGLWQPIPRVAGPAFPVACPAGDNLMMHIAIHRAPPGSVIVCAAGDCNWAMAGGNVCAWAQRRGVAGIVVDGLIRDVGEVRAAGFAVFARGVIPIPAARKVRGLIGVPVVCGGVVVSPGDMVVADEEGIVVLPAEGAETLRLAAEARAARDAARSLEAWVEDHKARVDEAAAKLGL